MVDETATNKPQVSQKSFFHRSELFSNRIGIYRGMYFKRRSNDVLRGPGPMLEPMDIFKMREDGTYVFVEGRSAKSRPCQIKSATVSHHRAGPVHDLQPNNR